MKSQSKNATNFKIVELLELEEIPPSQLEKISGGYSVDTNGDGVLDSSMTLADAQAQGYICFESGRCW
ncbi:hypothetical protein H6G36_28815 [Anabaena minutissima FACHB-250]|nr:hypothetical protein [Anabaena minutissima FACHB-250]